MPYYSSKTRIFFFFFLILDDFVSKTWISRRVYYFVGILNRVRDIFLLNYFQAFSFLNIRFRDISKPYKSLIQKKIILL